ncbi:erythromycin esterase family protein [Streptomyces uncialis]|uniref:erythromycin esterase family protein n=1 Tax=Streptomyces uncialis TaxID=1048205 RepID=UPI00093E6498|nr:erythromycin esterase family protein [Streptomyces uncialis]
MIPTSSADRPSAGRSGAGRSGAGRPDGDRSGEDGAGAVRFGEYGSGAGRSGEYGSAGVRPGAVAPGAAPARRPVRSGLVLALAAAAVLGTVSAAPAVSAERGAGAGTVTAQARPPHTGHTGHTYGTGTGHADGIGAAVGTGATEGTGGTSHPYGSDRAVLAGLNRHAHPLRATAPGDQRPAGDLATLARMTRDAEIIGFGEVTHGSKEVFDVRERLFRYLATRPGDAAVTTFALEQPWSTGVRLDTWVRTGEGDLRTIMREEFQSDYTSWRTEEFHRLFSWMREYNRTHDRQLRVMGNDIGDIGREQYARVLGWAERHRPALLPVLRERYAQLLDLPAGRDARMKALIGLPPAQRRSLAADAQAAHRLLSGSGTGTGTGTGSESGRVPARVVQEALVISQMATMYSLDGAELHRFRDDSMARNTVWWQRDTGERVLAAAHNGHLAYQSAWPQQYPVTQGAALRDLVGDDYVAIGTSVHSAGFLARPETGGDRREVFDTGAAHPGSNEHTLDRVRHRDFVIDLRGTTGDRATAAWLAAPRPTFLVPATYVPSVMREPQSLAEGYDVIVHLHRAEAATPFD